MSKATTEKGTTGKARDQKLIFYHPSASGGGSALQLEPRLNRRDTDRYNCFFMEMAAQKTAGGKDGDKKVFATFDWENKLTVKLDFPDLCEILAVLEGRQERAGGQRNGIYHETERASTVISAFKNVEKGGFVVGLSRKDKGSGTLQRVHITLTDAEALGLRYVLQAGLFFVTFHSHLFPLTAEPKHEDSPSAPADF